MAILDASLVHPITLPDGTVYRDTVYLKNVIDHPRMEIGEFSYYTHSGPVGDTALILAPYLGHGVLEKLIIGKFVQIARGSYFITSSANHPMNGFTTYPFRIFKPETFGYKDLPVKDTVVEHDVWIGQNAAIMPGSRSARARLSRRRQWSLAMCRPTPSSAGIRRRSSGCAIRTT